MLGGPDPNRRAVVLVQDEARDHARQEGDRVVGRVAVRDADELGDPGRIGHDAHLPGAAVGVVLAAEPLPGVAKRALRPQALDPELAEIRDRLIHRKVEPCDRERRLRRLHDAGRPMRAPASGDDGEGDEPRGRR